MLLMTIRMLYLCATKTTYVLLRNLVVLTCHDPGDLEPQHFCAFRSNRPPIPATLKSGRFNPGLPGRFIPVFWLKLWMLGTDGDGYYSTAPRPIIPGLLHRTMHHEEPGHAAAEREGG